MRKPHRWWGIGSQNATAIGACAVAVLTTASWLLLADRYGWPGWDVLFTFNRHDMVYAPSMAAFFHPFTDSIVLDTPPNGPVRFPWVALVTHATLLKVFGPFGLWLAETLFVVVRFVALYLFLRIFTKRKEVALFTAFAFETLLVWRLAGRLMAVSGVVARVLAGLSLEAFTPPRFPQGMFDPENYNRIPRPLVIVPFFFLGLTALGPLVKSGRAGTGSEPPLGKREGLWLGLAVAAIVSCYVHHAVVICLLIIALITLRASRTNKFRALLPFVGTALGTFFVGLIPLALQNGLFSNAEVQRRWGVIPQTFGLVGTVQEWLWLVAALSLLLLARLIDGRRAGTIRRFVGEVASRDAVPFLLLLTLATVAAMPVMPLLIGRAAQDGQYFDIQNLAVFASFLVLLAVVIDVAWDRLERTRWWARHGRNVVLAAILLCVASGLRGLMVAEPLHDRHPRAGTPGYDDFGDGYRQAFVEINQFLRGREPYRVILTYDTILEHHLVGFAGKRSYSPDPGEARISDADLEDRFLRGLQAVGARAEWIPGFLNEPKGQSYWNIFYLGTAKYGFSRKYSLAPLSEYSPEALRFLPGVSFSPWGALVVPEKQVESFVSRFRALGPGAWRKYRLDYIVLLNNSREMGLQPDPKDFEPVFRNAVFRVYGKRSSRG